MTILGKHTIDETQHLMKTVEFRIENTDRLNNQISADFIRNNSEKYRVLQMDWANFKNRWKIARAKALSDIRALNISNPLVPVSAIPCEDTYKMIKKAINVGGEETYITGDLTDCVQRISLAAGATVDETNKPMPTGFDPDFAAYREVDAGIKQGEAAAKAAGEKAKQVAKSNIGLMIGIGVGAVVGTVVLTKVYL